MRAGHRVPAWAVRGGPAGAGLPFWNLAPGQTASAQAPSRRARPRPSRFRRRLFRLAQDLDPSRTGRRRPAGRRIDEARMHGEQVGDGCRDLLGMAHAAEGCKVRIWSCTRAAVPGGWLARNAWYRWVAMDPRATALTRIPRGPWSTATARIRLSIAALAVACGSAPRTARCTWCEETWTIVPLVAAARNRRPAVAHRVQPDRAHRPDAELDQPRHPGHHHPSTASRGRPGRCLRRHQPCRPADGRRALRRDRALRHGGTDTALQAPAAPPGHAQGGDPARPFTGEVIRPAIGLAGYVAGVACDWLILRLPA